MIGKYEDAFPRVIDKNDPNWSPFIAKLNELDNYVRAKIEGLDTLYDYQACPSEVVKRLGAIVYAGIEIWDDDTARRKKVRDAVRKHQFSSTWLYDVKLVVETYTGLTAYLYNFRSISFFAWDANNELTTELGWNKTRWDGSGSFPNSLAWNIESKIIKGIAYIDVNTSTLTQDDWDILEIELEKSAPAFFRIYVGYIDSGDWVTKLTFG